MSTSLRIWDCIWNKIDVDFVEFNVKFMRNPIQSPVITQRGYEQTLGIGITAEERKRQTRYLLS